MNKTDSFPAHIYELPQNGMSVGLKKSLDYARTHRQAVRIVWLDREPEVIPAVKAVELCSDCGVSGRIVRAVAQDERLNDMLGKLLDKG